jgi:tetratricopeptide (TPR) repeat protein
MIYIGKNNLNGAVECFDIALEICEFIAQETGESDSLRKLSFALCRAGDMRIAQGTLNGAEDYFRKSLKIAEDLAHEDGTLESRQILARSLQRLGSFLSLQGKLNDAESCFRRSIEILDSLTQESETVANYDLLAIGYFQLAKLRQPYEPYNCEFLQKALHIYTNLAKQCPNVVRFQDLIFIIKATLDSL